MKNPAWYTACVVLLALTFVGCAKSSIVQFPDPDTLFMTTGDGDIQKPYTPIGQVIYIESGYRIPLPLFGLLPVYDVDPEIAIREGLEKEVRKLGGDAVINVEISWIPPSSGLLGLFANGGHVFVTGTAIKR